MLGKFNEQKAKEIILYFAQKSSMPDIYHLGKVIYFADQLHLERYGTLLCNDEYKAMKYGPVAYGTYCLVKRVQAANEVGEDISEDFEMDSSYIIPKRAPNLDELSRSNLDALNESMAEYGSMSFHRLKNISHDAAYHSVGLNEMISFDSLVDLVPGSDLLREHLAS